MKRTERVWTGANLSFVWRAGTLFFLFFFVGILSNTTDRPQTKDPICPWIHSTPYCSKYDDADHDNHFAFHENRAELLDSVIFRTGILASLRSKKLDGKVIGVMITASHNPAAVSERGETTETRPKE